MRAVVVSFGDAEISRGAGYLYSCAMSCREALSGCVSGFSRNRGPIFEAGTVLFQGFVSSARSAACFAMSESRRTASCEASPTMSQ